MQYSDRLVDTHLAENECSAWASADHRLLTPAGSHCTPSNSCTTRSVHMSQIRGAENKHRQPYRERF